MGDDQPSHPFEGGEFERLKTRFADITYRHTLEKTARMHLETIYDKATRNEKLAIEKNNALQDELQKLRKVCSESTAIRHTLEFRLKKYSQTRRDLEYQLSVERHARQCSDNHVSTLANSLKLMGRLLQVQFPSGNGNLPRLAQRDTEQLRSEAPVSTGT